MNLEFFEQVVPVLPIIIIFSVLGIAFYADKKRKEAIKNIAEMKGWKYEEPTFELFKNKETLEKFGHSTPQVDLNDKSLKWFPKGTMRQGSRSNIIVGSLGSNSEGMLFDLTIGSGKSKKTHTYFQIIFKDLKFPSFKLSKEGLFSKVIEKMGFSDIDFGESPEFSDKYRLVGKDEAAIRNLFNSSVQHYFTTNQNWQIEAEDNIILGTQNKKLAPEKWAEVIDEMREIADVFIRK